MLEILDTLKFSKWHIIMVISLGSTWIFDGYEVSMLNLVALQLTKTFHKTKSQIGFIASIYLLGCCLGALTFGIISSKFGRKKLFIITLLIYGVSVVGSSLMPEYYSFTIFRFFTGIGVGGEYTAIFAAIDELIPP